MTDEFIMQFIRDHAVLLVAGQALWSAFVQALPQPTSRGSRFYLFLYRFCHLIAMNLKLVNRKPKGSI